MAGALNRVVRQGEVHLVALDPTRGREIRKSRPCVIISPDEMNRHLGTVIVAPMTTATRSYPTRVPCTFDAVEGQVAVDQLRTVHAERLVTRLGALEPTTLGRVLAVLREMFSE